MKLRTFLDQLFDETWVCITDTEGHKHYLWMIDFDCLDDAFVFKHVGDGPSRSVYPVAK